MNPHLIRVLPVFSAVFAVIYVLATDFNWALLTYHPATGAWGLGVQPAKAPRQPAMYWYGWLLTAFIAGALAGGVATLLPRDLAGRAWPGLVWAIPVASMLFVLYILRGYVLR